MSAPALTRPDPPRAPFFGALLARFHIDFDRADPQPSWWRWALATVVSLAGSLAADAALVAAGESVFPTTKHFVHFRFSDYAKLTVIGVVVACVAWPVVTRITSQPRWLFVRMAVVVTLVLLLPDLYIWHLGEPVRAVGVLMLMHLAIALVTYNALVRIAPAGDSRVTGGGLATRG
ncbi:MAG: DUF6069 family protein [Acidimicrobiales bacterium]